MSDVLRASNELWASSVVHDGTVSRWLFRPGSQVSRGTPIVEIKVGDRYHTIAAPISGRLDIRAAADSVIKPGAMLGFIAPQGWRRLATYADADRMSLAS